MSATKKNKEMGIIATATSFIAATRSFASTGRSSEKFCAACADSETDMSGLKISESKSTKKIGPIEQIATTPKLFSFLLLPPSTPATPTPSAIINGTVIGPVVMPPESNESGMYLSSTNIATIKTRAYSAINTIFKEIFANILPSANTRKSPTPSAIVIIKSIFISPSCEPKTIKSGSAIVTITPIPKPTISISGTFFVSVTLLPIVSPIGARAVSLPSE